MSFVVKGVGNLIGLATEAHAHHSKRGADSRTVNIQVVASNSEELDEEIWALDDASGEMTEVPPETQESRETLTSEPPGYTVREPAGLIPLLYPVILPQRRPQTKARGFVRAYAPLLGECKGINEATFHRFLADFHKSSQASPYLRGINAAAMIGSVVPSITAIAVSLSVQAAAKGAMEVQNRYRTNAFLDQANEALFHPVNLHCMIMTFKPQEVDQAYVDLDFETSNRNLSKVVSVGPVAGKLNISSGITKGELAVPMAAPLVFTVLDKAAQEDCDDSRVNQSAWKRSNKFVASYLDRRAQAQYAGTHGDASRLAIPGAIDPKNFASRYSDPNHPANSGSLIALATGGMVNPAGLRKGCGDKLSRLLAGSTGMAVRRERGILPVQLLSGIKDGGVKRLLEQDVLYLIIAEMPSQEEMNRLTRSFLHQE